MADRPTIEQLREEFRAARAATREYVAILPARATAQPKPYVNGLGQHIEAHRGWTDDEHAQVAELRARERELVARLAELRTGKTGPGARCT
jgi:hypothetical protein